MPRFNPVLRSTALGALMLLGSAALVLGLSACGDDDPGDGGNDLEVTEILSHVGSSVIEATYLELDQAADQLVTATAALAADPTPAHLETARAAWRTARRPWEQSEGFLFGPVDTEGIDPSIDSWPVNVTDLNAVMAGSSTLTVDFVDGLEGTLKGFHTIEYLLFGETGDRTAASLTPRELEYLAAVTGSLAGATQELYDAWRPSGGDYTGELARAGGDDSRYPSQRAALQDLVVGMSTIADEVANGKINDPFTTGDVTLEESRFAANSLADFQDNIRSIKNVYMGIYGISTGPGVTEFVRERDITLDDRFQDEVDAAINAIGDIPGPFTTAITLHPAAVEAAQTAVRRVQQTLDEDIAPLIGN